MEAGACIDHLDGNHTCVGLRLGFEQVTHSRATTRNLLENTSRPFTSTFTV
jgi:hypothetical protein